MEIRWITEWPEFLWSYRISVLEVNKCMGGQWPPEHWQMLCTAHVGLLEAWGVSELINPLGYSYTISPALPGAICCPPSNPGACHWWLANHSITLSPSTIFLAYYVDTSVKACHGVLSHSKLLCMDFWCLRIACVSPSISLTPSLLFQAYYADVRA